MEAVAVIGLKETEKYIVKSTPKALIKIGAQTILENQIRNLEKIGASRLTIVSGGLSSEIKNHLDQINGVTMKIRLLVNPEYATTGSAFSFLYGLLGIDSDLMYIDEGSCYEFSAYRHLIQKSDGMALGIRRKLSVESMYIQTKGNNLIAAMTRETDKEGIIGKYAGMAWIPQRYLLDLRCQLHTLFQAPYRRSIPLEEAVQSLISAQSTAVEWVDLSDYLGDNISTQKHLKNLRAEWRRVEQETENDAAI